MRRMFRVLNTCLVLMVASCVTVNVYFPAAAVQKAADEIVEDVQGNATDNTSSKPKPSSWLEQNLRRVGFGVSVAYAEVDIKVSTPAIRALKDSLKAQYAQLKPFYEKGAIGENNNGLVELKDTGALNLQERGQITSMVQQENKDRMSLYREIATANKLGPDSVPQIQKIFANSWRRWAKPGTWIQDDGGAWAKKP